MKLIITKIAELADAVHPHNIPVGHEQIVHTAIKQSPVIGCRFPASSWWSTSIVTEIISDNKFKTLNSVYEFKHEDDDIDTV